MVASPMGSPMGGDAFPRTFGGSITMPVARPAGLTIGPCGNPGCSKPGLLQCSQCGQKAYCSVECQQKDWPAHKAECKRIAAARSANPAAAAAGAPSPLPPGAMGQPSSM